MFVRIEISSFSPRVVPSKQLPTPSRLFFLRQVRTRPNSFVRYNTTRSQVPCNFSSSWATWIEPFRRAQFARAAEIRVTGKLAETSINSSSNLTYFVARREMNFDEVRFFESISFPFVQVFPSCASRGRCPRGNVIDRWAKKREERVA